MGSVTGSIIMNTEGEQIYVGATAPDNPSKDQLWLNTQDEKVYRYDGSEWVTSHEEIDLSDYCTVEQIKSNYYDKTETDERIETVIGETSITTKDGEVVNMKEALNTVIDTAKEHTQRISDTETAIEDNEKLINSVSTLATQTSNKFDWIVKSGTSSSDMVLTDNMLQVIAENINLTGKVSFKSFAPDTVDNILDGVVKEKDIYVEGTTVINGGRIDTSTLIAKNIIVKETDAEDANTLFSALQNTNSKQPRVTLAEWIVENNTLISSDGKFSLSMSGAGTTIENNSANINISAKNIYLEGTTYAEGALAVHNNNFVIKNDTTTTESSKVLDVVSKTKVNGSILEIMMYQKEKPSIVGTSGTTYFTDAQIKTLVGTYVSIKDKGYSNKIGRVQSFTTYTITEDESHGGLLTMYERKYAKLVISSTVPSSNTGYSFYSAPSNTNKLVLSKEGQISSSYNGTHYIGGNTSSSATLLVVRNSLASVSLNIAANGNIGVYDNTNNNWIIYRKYSDKRIYFTDIVSDTATYRLLGTTTISSGNNNIPTSGAVYDALSSYQTKTGNYANVYKNATTRYARVQNKNNNVDLRVGTNAGIYHESVTGYSSSGWVVYISTSGSITVNTKSDRRSKDLIEYLSDDEARALLTQVNPIVYTYKSEKEEAKLEVNTGFFAQDIRDCLIKNNIGYRSYLVMHDNNSENVYDLEADEKDIKYGLDYSKLVPTLWRGWQMHECEIEKLKSELSDIKSRLKRLED